MCGEPYDGKLSRTVRRAGWHIAFHWPLLYILSTIYRNSELSTTGGLIYFLLGSFSSCFILLGSGLLYANSGTTNLDNIYIISNISENIYCSCAVWYKAYYINFSLLILSIGFLFKVSAAPFHFWSPYKRPGKSYLLGNLLSNYGNTLGIMVPSLKLNYINGWTNYSCRVISQNIYENNVVSHVSKSVILNNIVVKEQRVYDSRYGNILLSLRCILMDFEIKYKIKNHSNLIIQKQFYSKRCETTRFEDNNLILNNKYTQLKPWFITGFADAEGCF